MRNMTNDYKRVPVDDGWHRDAPERRSDIIEITGRNR